MKNSISYVFDKFNNTNEDIVMELKQTLANQLLDKSVANSYSLGVTKLDIPTSKIESLYFEDRDKYTITNSYYDHSNSIYQTYSSKLPSFQSHGIKYYTKEQILDHINRCLSNNYFQYLENQSDTNCVKINTFTSAHSEVITFSDNISISTSYTKLSGMKLFISAMAKISGDDNQIIKFFLQSPSGQRCHFFIGKIKDIVKYSGYDINDFSFMDWNNADPQKVTDTGIKSYESFTKLSSSTCTGNWKIGIESSQAFTITLGGTLYLYFSDNHFIPTLPLFVSRNNDQLKLNAQHYYLYNNHQVGFSRTLYNSLAFTINSKVVNNVIYLEWDPTIINTTLTELIVFSQEQNSLNALSNIKEIQLRSSCFSSVGENIISSNSQSISSGVLVEFVINKDQNLGNFLLYSQTNEFWRVVDVSAISNNIRNIDFSIYATYDGGFEKQLYLSSGEGFSVRISFVRG